MVVLSLDIDPDKRDTEQVKQGIYATASRARALHVVVGDSTVLQRSGMADLAQRFDS